MDYFPAYFSQRELSWLDDVIPHEAKKGPKHKKRTSSYKMSLESGDLSKN